MIGIQALVAGIGLILLVVGLCSRRLRLFEFRVMFFFVLAGFAVYLINPFVVGSTPENSAFLRNGFVAIRLGYVWFAAALVTGITCIGQVINKYADFRIQKALAAITILLIVRACDYHVHIGAVRSVLDGYLFSVPIKTFPYLPCLLGLTGTAVYFWGLRQRGSRRTQVIADNLIVVHVAMVAVIVVSSDRYVMDFGRGYDMRFGTRVFSAIDTTPSEVFGTASQPWVCVMAPKCQPFAGPHRRIRVSSAHAICAIPIRFRTTNDLREYFDTFEFTHVVVQNQAGDRNAGAFIRLCREDPGIASLVWTDQTFLVFRLNPPDGKPDASHVHRRGVVEIGET